MHATFIFLQSWSDEKLKWDPNDYNGLKTSQNLMITYKWTVQEQGQ
jgi:hypothetical protein